MRSARGRDHAREAVRPAAPGTAVPGDGRDREWKELRDGAVRIEQTIYVERESQRKIVLGKGGADHQGDRRRGAQGDRRADRAAGAPVPVREGARGLGRRPGALPRRWGSSFRRSEACLRKARSVRRRDIGARRDRHP